jgi:hypothetical protein
MQNEESSDLNQIVRAILLELYRDTLDELREDIGGNIDEAVHSNTTSYMPNLSSTSTSTSDYISNSNMYSNPIQNNNQEVHTPEVDQNTSVPLQDWYLLSVRQQNLIREVLSDYNHSFNEFNRNYTQIIQSLREMNQSILNMNSMFTSSASAFAAPSPNTYRTNNRGNLRNVAAPGPSNTGTNTSTGNGTRTGTGGASTGRSNGIGNTRIYSTNIRIPNTTNTSNPFYTFYSNYVLPIRIRYTDLSDNTLPPLTSVQISNATQLITYRRNMNETRCPISWEEFREGERITQIKHCEHIFKTNELTNWLRTNSQCPVCRYDLRTYTPPAPTTRARASEYRQQNQPNEIEESDVEDVDVEDYELDNSVD